MKFFVVLLVATATLVCGSYGLPNTRILFDKWIEFKTIFGKKYEDHEEPKRLDIFKENLARIEAHNKLYEQGKVPYKMAVNKFADMTAEEFFQHIRPVKLDREQLLTARAKNGNLHNRTLHERPLNFQSYGSVDWRSQGAVTGVKNQGSCGSCWSFSATGALEGQLALRTGRLVSLSEQNLIDCSTQYGNQACSGGWPDLAFDYVKDYGIASEQEYPYEGQFDYCRYQRGEAVLSTIRGPVDIRPGSEQDLEHAVATVGPISVAIDVTQNFQFYSSGIFYDQYCDTESLNHAVLTVGYGNQGEYSYWIVKNSWGEEWGDAGYVYMIKDYGNNCGIASAASYPSM